MIHDNDNNREEIEIDKENSVSSAATSEQQLKCNLFRSFGMRAEGFGLIVF